jgi:hypothetical protein
MCCGLSSVALPQATLLGSRQQPVYKATSLVVKVTIQLVPVFRNTTTSINNFKCEPLDITAKEIHLLILHPAQGFNDKIDCDILQTSLQDHPQFAALSHTRGDASITKPIWRRAQCFNVTANVESAPRHLREQGHPKKIWIGAAFID